MDPTILTTVGTAVTMMGGLLTVIARLKADLKQDIGEVKTNLKEVKADLEKDIQRVETNLGEVKADLEKDIRRVETNLTGDIRRVDDRVWQLVTLIIRHTDLPPDDFPPPPERQPTERNPVNA